MILSLSSLLFPAKSPNDQGSLPPPLTFFLVGATPAAASDRFPDAGKGDVAGVGSPTETSDTDEERAELRGSPEQNIMESLLARLS